MADIIYIVGHKNPDTDSVCSAIALADFYTKQVASEEGEDNAKQNDSEDCAKQEGLDEFVSAVQGEINEETKFVLNKFGFNVPQILTDGTDKSVILVDHNAKTQTLDNIEKAKIIGVVDHHAIAFSYSEPIDFSTEAVGSTATMIANMYFEEGCELDKKIAGILLAAILSDTAIFKSATTTETDMSAAEMLAEVAGIDDIEAFGWEIKKAKASLKGKTTEQIINMDFKDYNMSGKKVGVGQLEVVDFEDFYAMKEQIKVTMETMRQSENYHLVLLAFTDIAREGSEFIAVGDVEVVKKAFNISSINRTFLKGIMSRKKQIAPPLENYFNFSKN